MTEEWKSYFCNVNDVLASIALNLGLNKVAPIMKRFLSYSGSRKKLTLSTTDGKPDAYCAGIEKTGRQERPKSIDALIRN